MVCAMDWINHGSLFYDVWVARGITGGLFLEISQSGSWEFVGKLFWNDLLTRVLFDAKQPFQMYACWNGAVAFDATPFLRYDVRFRASQEGECYMGEPTLFCKDLWKKGYGRIAVIPAVNVGHDDAQSRFIKANLGYVATVVHDTELNSHSMTTKATRAGQMRARLDSSSLGQVE